MKILVIEDNEQDQKIIQRFLRSRGVDDITLASSGQEGIRKACDARPDLVLLDTVLPDMDGFEICRRIKAEMASGVRVIMMTGHVAAVEPEKARDAGADEYCVKTADGRSLLEAVSRVFPSPADGADVSTAAGSMPGDASSGDWGPGKARDAIKMLSMELERKNKELKALDQLKSNFIANVSHELRTPLTIIKGAVSQVISGIYGLVTEEQRKKLLMALRNAERLNLMIDDLLDFAKLEAKQVHLDLTEVNMVELAREAHSSFYSLAVEKGLDLNLEYPAPLMRVYADRNLLIQVLTNLIGNSLKFTEKGDIKIVLKEEPYFIECRVADTGCGIPEDELSRVFDRFHQVGARVGDHPKGTGLGLSICKEIIGLHKGSIWAESAFQKGTAVIFTIPKKGHPGPEAQ
ncbi:MAG TPA: hybrid sensor histidine kinase/response regulator [Candidatus Omnitrophota bacterium]|nr:hybrid sensor histidine kinase/response regulator [Candidatus Omnitrophota bacterium]HPN56731.1 hybrid sensor histidine kinase/response regulator [Candidatus Omnitrophota bacterium]